MPEGDTVARVARTLDLALSGQVATTVDLRVPSAPDHLGGRTVMETVSIGKHLLTRLDGGATIHSHLKMEGSWVVYRSGQRARGPWHQIRAVIGNEAVSAVGYRLGKLEVVPTKDEGEIVGHLGPDIVSDRWDMDEALRRISGQPGRSVGEALLDQRNVAGIGNLYRNEALFLAGVDPTAAVSEVDVAKILSIAHRAMVANLSHWSQTTTGDTRKGHRHWVFERTGQPCLRCGGRILSELHGAPARLIYRCPTCQPSK